MLALNLQLSRLDNVPFFPEAADFTAVISLPQSGVCPSNGEGKGAGSRGNSAKNPVDFASPLQTSCSSKTKSRHAMRVTADCESEGRHGRAPFNGFTDY
jgi:hypothetical protein